MTTKKQNKEVDDAQDAKKSADPSVNDPAFMPNIEPQTGDSHKTTKVDKAVKKADPDVRVDPSGTRLIPGNSASFSAEDRDGNVTVKLIANGQPSFIVTPSRSGGRVSVTKIFERPGPLVVEFYENGTKYASGSYEVN